MAKDGTYRGGRRIRAGSKPDSAADKIKSGKTPRIMNNEDFSARYQRAKIGKCNQTKGVMDRAKCFRRVQTAH